ncbi:MAG TPA: head GIN domain-containing protein [Chitinophagaceae bacterium]|nr:head GIN domain-containing protein [Chitinophagaceae bacterium]
MPKLKTFISFLLFIAFKITFAQNTTLVDHFNKVIVSPNIEVSFVEGNEEKVTIEKSTVESDKINIHVNGKTLRIYLDDAKELVKNEKKYENGDKVKRPIYKGTVVTATVMYKTLEELSIRGEETIVCKSVLKGDRFTLKIYGESEVLLNDVNLDELKTTIYGESSLVIKAGSVKEQKYTAYGESKINSLGINSNTTKITVYGESDFQINVSDEIKLTAFGEAVVNYKGNPTINKGINIGQVRINRID